MKVETIAPKLLQELLDAVLPHQELGDRRRGRLSQRVVGDRLHGLLWLRLRHWRGSLRRLFRCEGLLFGLRTLRIRAVSPAGMRDPKPAKVRVEILR